MQDETRNPATYLPLKQSVFQVLLALGDQDMHGYGIMQALREKTAGQERILPGTLYATIARLVENGLVEALPPKEGLSSGGPQRRYYRRTPLGREVLRAESERMRVLVDLALAENVLQESER